MAPVVMALGASPSNNLLGVGSYSDSLSTYPPTGPVTTGDWYVDIDNGTDSTASGNGTSHGSPLRTISYAISVASTGDTILVMSGDYAISTSLRPKQGQKIFGYGTERPRLIRGPFISGASNNYHFYVTEDDVHVKGFELVGGIDNTGNSHSSLVVRVNEATGVAFEDIVSHSGQTGAMMFYNTTDCMALDCISIGCSGAGSGSNRPDGFMGSGTVGVLNDNLKFIRCLSANVGDDGTDFYYAKNSHVIDCVTIATNYSPVNGSNLGGDGNGFKMGGASGAGPNHLRGSIAVYCRGQGLNHNSTSVSGNTYINNTSLHNYIGMISDSGSSPANTTRNLVLGNDSRNGEVNTAGPRTYNSWNLGITYSSAEFSDPANGDWSLLPNSDAIGAGPSGENLGASEVALSLLKKWWNHSQIWVPGRGNGPGGTGLPGDSA